MIRQQTTPNAAPPVRAPSLAGPSAPLAWLGLLSCGLLACSVMPEALRPSPPPEPPVELSFDIYGSSDARLRSSALPSPPVTSAAAATEWIRGNSALLEHLRAVDAQYAGRRLPRLEWTASVRRVAPPQTQDRAYWDVALESSPVRGSALYYGCELRVSDAGTALSSEVPQQICGWRERY